MSLETSVTPLRGVFGTGLALFLMTVVTLPAQQMVTETRDPKQAQDEEFAKAYQEWTGDAHYGSPLVDHLPLVKGIPTPKDVLGYYIGAPPSSPTTRTSSSTTARSKRRRRA